MAFVYVKIMPSGVDKLLAQHLLSLSDTFIYTMKTNEHMFEGVYC